MMDMEMNADLGDEGSEVSQLSASCSSASSTFCNLEKDYARITSEMKSNEALAAYEAEYTRLYEALFKSHKNEEDLLEQCNSYKDEISEHTRKIYDLSGIIESDTQEIARLKRDIEQAMKLADAAHTREQNAQEVIENLRLNITKLNREIELKNKQLAGDEEGGGVSKQREGLLKERERLLGEMDTLKQRLKNLSQYTEDLEKKFAEAEEQIQDLQETLDIRTSEVAKEKRGRERIEQDFQQLHEEFTMKTEELNAANEAIKTATSNIAKLEASLKEQKLAGEKMSKEINKLTVKKLALQEELEHTNARVSQLDKQNADKDKQLRTTRHEYNKAKEETAKARSEKEILDKRFMKVDLERVKLEQEVKQANSTIRNIDYEMSTLRRQQFEDKQKYEALMREKNLMARSNETLREHIRSLNHEIAVLDTSKKKLENELNNAIQRENEAKRQIEVVEKERDRYHAEAKELAQKVEDYISEIKLKQVEIFDYKKRLAESEAKYRQQQNLFEAVRAERNACSKSLREAQDEVNELKEKLKIMIQQIEQLKEDVATKEGLLIKKDFILGRVEREREGLKVELQHARKNISDLRGEIEEMKAEEKRLRQNIREADRDITRHKKQIDNVMNERDILGTQLVRRNDELTLQYSRIKILNGTLQRGEAEYNERLDDIKLLKLEVKKLRTEKTLLMKNIDNMSDMRQEIFHLNRDLTRERLKVMALEEEIQTPLNIHRWRKLEFYDPSSFEMMKKIQFLQKYVIKMSATMIDKEKKIQDTEKLYMNLREIMAKQPGPDIAKALDKTQQALRERSKKMKCLVSELNMYEVQISEYKFDMERMRKEMCELKSQFFSQKKKLQKKEESTAQAILPPVSPQPRRYYGGGFNMAVPTPRTIVSLDSGSR